MEPRHHPLLETDLLRTFVKIAETGSFSRAAKSVFRTPSAVSMQMRKLEETLGRSLFRREGRSVCLTADGESLLGDSRRLLKLNEETVARFLAPPLEGLVRFGAPDDFGTRFLPNILARFATTHPGVEVDVRLEQSIDLLRRLDEDGLDLTLVTQGRSSEPPGQGEVMFSEPLVWTGLKNGEAWERDPLPLALSGQGCVWRGAALAALDRAGRRYRIAYSSDYCAGQKAALDADLAIAPFPASLVAPPLRLLGVAQGLPPLIDYQIRLYRAPARGAVADAFAEHVTQSFQEMVAVRRGAA